MAPLFCRRREQAVRELPEDSTFRGAADGAAHSKKCQANRITRRPWTAPSTGSEKPATGIAGDSNGYFPDTPIYQVLSLDDLLPVTLGLSRFPNFGFAIIRAGLGELQVPKSFHWLL